MVQEVLNSVHNELQTNLGPSIQPEATKVSAFVISVIQDPKRYWPVKISQRRYTLNSSWLGFSLGGCYHLLFELIIWPHNKAAHQIPYPNPRMDQFPAYGPKHTQPLGASDRIRPSICTNRARSWGDRSRVDDLHEEGCGEHEADGDHDDGQSRVPFHRNGAGDRLGRLREHHRRRFSTSRNPGGPRSPEGLGFMSLPSRRIWADAARRRRLPASRRGGELLWSGGQRTESKKRLEFVEA